MNEATKGGILVGGLLAVGIALGLTIGWKLWKPKPAPVETAAPAARQADGSLVLERKPDAAAKPAQELPKGAKVERIVQVTVQPKAVQPLPGIPTPGSGGAPEARTPGMDPASAPGNPGTTSPCPPVRVDLTLVRMPDQTRRVIASSPDGTVVGGVDIPEAPQPQPRVLKWAAGGSWNPADHTYGAWVDRDAAFLRLGAEVNQVRAPALAGGATSYEARIRVGIRF